MPLGANEHIDRGRAIGDYLRVLRRRGVLILAFVAGGGGAALALPAPQKTTYSAQATLLFQDPTQDPSPPGPAGGVFRTADQRAQIGADTIVSPQLATAVKGKLRTSLTPAAIKDALSAEADPASGQVFLTAEAGTARLAA